MKVITKYQAFDGVEFLDSGKCEAHESNCTISDGIFSLLPATPDSCDFTNGGGYIQHVESDLLKVRNKFLEFVKRYSDHKWIQETIDNGFDVHPSYAGRIIDECTPQSISKLWYRFMCIDSNFREWGQPYYATNPEKAECKKLN